MGSEDVKVDVFWICDVSTVDIKEMMNPDDKPVLRNHFKVAWIIQIAKLDKTERSGRCLQEGKPGIRFGNRPTWVYCEKCHAHDHVFPSMNSATPMTTCSLLWKVPRPRPRVSLLPSFFK